MSSGPRAPIRRNEAACNAWVGCKHVVADPVRASLRCETLCLCADARGWEMGWELEGELSGRGQWRVQSIDCGLLALSAAQRGLELGRVRGCQSISGRAVSQHLSQNAVASISCSRLAALGLVRARRRRSLALEQINVWSRPAASWMHDAGAGRTASLLMLPMLPSTLAAAVWRPAVRPLPLAGWRRSSARAAPRCTTRLRGTTPGGSLSRPRVQRSPCRAAAGLEPLASSPLLLLLPLLRLPSVCCSIHASSRWPRCAGRGRCRVRARARGAATRRRPRRAKPNPPLARARTWSRR